MLAVLVPGGFGRSWGSPTAAGPGTWDS